MHSYADRADRPRFLTDFADQGDTEELVIPENLTELSDEDIDQLHAKAVEAFDAVYGDGTELNDDQLSTLEELSASVDALRAELDTRTAAKTERSEKAAELAARVRPAAEEAAEQTEDAPEAVEGEDGAELAADTDAPEAVEAEEPETVTAGARNKGLRLNLSGLRNRRPSNPPKAPEASAIVAAPGVRGYAQGQPMSKLDMAKAVDSKLSGFNATAYSNAAKRGQALSERFQIAMINRDFPAELIVQDGNAADAIAAAIDQTRLPQGSLIAAGGWCAPSEILYDLCNISESANLISLPEIQVNRGGIQYATGPDYSTVYGQTGFCFTEQDDIDGTYEPGAGPTDPNVEGPKPCFHVPCPEFEDARLGVCGICITSGLLQARGYPEAIENYIDLALNAHAHRVSAAVIADLVADSTAVSLPANQAGATAPILTAIELQATHYRAVNRMSDTAVLEAVFPTWVKGVIRSDLARRLGVDLISVPDARILEWFRAAGINPQFVVDWQDIATTGAAAFTQWPTTVSFLLYAAGTFVKGVSPSITFENIYDSVGLGTNDYTALFTEDPYLVAKRCHDSRVVTVPVCADGSTNIGVDIACDGTGPAA